ncbi:terminase large subunit [Halobacillus sp. Marseille-P3879]|uniref:terminase large subunit n=1 Tax=Halobacillus sp. Marseille-P3879 TaxID=2045014 RepID=UPI000C7C3F40|nr:terminase TerL endonuclease subunit [Halobacillus sp. Marseille-P3879]
MSLIERVWSYATDIVEGDILACKKHVQACQRFFDDVNKIEDDDFEYYFDGDELIDFYDWAKMFKHVEGKLANQPIELTDFQLFLVANIFCWKSKKNHTRKFKRVYIQLARKQAKSQLQALIASYVGFLSEEKQQIYIAGVTKEQSKIVYQQILDQIDNAKFLSGKYKTSYGVITHKKSGSVIQPLSKEARKTGDGKFPSLNIIDEYHAHETSEIFDVLLSGMIGRLNTLHVVITTAGLDLNVPCFKEYEYVSKILDPESTVDNDEYFAMICELEPEDDIKLEKNWIKANPIVATYEEGMDALRSRLKVALEQPEKMTEFLTKHMNIWVQAKENGYMDLKRWNNCGIGKGESLPDISGKEVYIGIDLSATLDLTSVAFLIPIGEDKFVVKGHSFMPENTLMSKMNTDKVPYDLYERQGWLSFTPGDVVDYRFLQKYIDEQVEKYNWKVKALYYDDWNATQFANNAADLGYITVKVVQGMKTLAPASKDFRELVYQEKIIHDNNPVINFAMGNAVTKMDHNENFMLDKSKSSQRIDPVASIITAHAHARFHYQYGDVGNYSDEELDKLGW